ncbi:hypothetical protein [Acuticoccus yangtzensis]|uniref:hypothetical protein n=1 Tax=Acuticoccus yangtzensis TaxID=1443441 RepID=UPI0009496DD5|nr:hypothetical protein [Acuticoccus yangtzensis]
MEEFLQVLGTIGLVFLVVVGALAGLIASGAEGGRNKVRNVAIGIVGAVVLPFIVALLATGVLAAGGLLLMIVIALIGAAVVLAVARMLFR